MENLKFNHIEPLRETKVLNNKEFFMNLRNAPEILEKRYGKISSFNFFRRNVGYEKDWEDFDGNILKARGLFLNNETYEIVGRSYNKFFGINEKAESMIENLKYTLKFPLNIYLKENGFLGILGYDSYSESPMFASKASVDGPFAENFKNIFMTSNNINKEKMKKVNNFMDNKNVSLIFEVIDPINNPHIIKYDTEQVILLDVVYREPNYRKFSYSDVVSTAKELGFKHKKKSFVINNWEEFLNWYGMVYQDNYLYEGQHIEGFVIEDAAGYMLKSKLNYYLLWKRMRKLKDKVRKNKEINLEELKTNTEIKFLNWISAKDKNECKKDIITLREMFYDELKQN